MRFPACTFGVAAALFIAPPALAKDHVVKMLGSNPAGAMVFEPDLVRVSVGDTVTFVATDKGHNAESIGGMLPTGAAPFKGAINQDLKVKFTKPGVYGFKCLPHYPLGMVGLVVVGNSSANLDAARKVNHPAKAKLVFARLFDSAGSRTASK